MFTLKNHFGAGWLLVGWLTVVLSGLLAAQSTGQTGSPEARPAAAPASTPARAPVSVAPSPSTVGTAGEDSAALEPADIVIANRVVATLRGARFGYSPQERARDAEERIGALLDQVAIGSVTAEPFEEGYRIRVGEKRMFNFLEADRDALSEETLDQARDRVVRRLRAAIEAAREQRRPVVILRGIAWTFGATLLAGFLVWLSLKLMTTLRERMAALAPSKLSRVSEDLAAFFSSPLRAWLNWLTRIGLVVVIIIVAYVWLSFSLRQFPLTQPWGDASRGFLFSLLENMGRGVLAEIPNLIFVLLILLITRAISKLMQLFFVAVEEKRISMPGLHPETIPVTRRLAVAVLWIFALVVAYPYLPGSDSLAFKGVSVFLGLVLSFGSGGVISQAASGIVLVYSRAFKPGDYIRVAETEGTVLEVGILSTKVRTNKLEVVNLPNSVLLGGTCKNFSTLAQDKGLIVYTSVTIGYDTPWRQVHAMLLLAADRTTALRKEPKPFVVQIALSDFYVEYQLNAYLDEPQRRLAVLAEMHAHIQDVFNEYGVQIMSPHYENDPGGAAKMVPKEQWYAAPAEPPPVKD